MPLGTPLLDVNNLSDLTALKEAMKNLFAGAGAVGAFAIRMPDDPVTGEVRWGFLQPDPGLAFGDYVPTMTVGKAGVSFAWKPK